MTTITLAANNAEMGGGEVMLLAIADGLRELGHDVRVVAPAGDTETVGAQAQRRGFRTTAIRGACRREYMAGLRRWDRQCREGVLWCNGHVPALATVGHQNRIVHLHQAPSTRHVVAGRLAAAGALVLLVPSASMAKHFPGAQILPNWVPEVTLTQRRHRSADDPVILGFLGRPSPDKGVLTLARALRELDRREPGRYRLLLAGEPRFVSPAEQERVEAALEDVRELVNRPGWMNRSEFFARIDLAVFPSEVEESFGLMVAEAMSARVPFIVSDAGALSEVAGSRYPWTCRAGDPNSLADVITTACHEQRTAVAATAATAHDRWEESFSPEAGLQHLRFLLTDVLPGEARS